VSNGIVSGLDWFPTLLAAAGDTDVKERLLTGWQTGGQTYKVHLDGFNQLDMWKGASKVSARKAYFYYDETELTAIRVNNWKMHIGVKKEGSWFNDKTYPSVPYLFHLRMDPMEKMDPESHEWGYIGRKFFANKLWAPTAGTPFIAEHLASLKAYPPRQAADTLSMHKALEAAMAKLDNPAASSN
jgi:arylsulfatase